MTAWTTRVAPGPMAILRWTKGFIALAAFLAVCMPGAGVAQDDGRGLLRYDPLAGSLVPIADEEAKVGCVYSHFSARLNRRVWAVRRADGGFSNALGEGTTQPAVALDIPGTTEQKRQKLEQINKELALQLDRAGGSVYFRLDHEDGWRLDSTANHVTIYDLETQRRWEWVNGRYIPVSSGPFAYRWQVSHGQYIPLEGRCSARHYTSVEFP